MKTHPLVTVIIPTFNRPDIIQHALYSVLTQVYQRFEIIIINDGSEIEYPDLAKIDNRIKYFYLSKNIGVAKAWNFGLDKAKGKYIAFLDDDDLWRPEHLELGVSFLEENLKFHGVYFQSQTIYRGKLGTIYGYPWETINEINPIRGGYAIIFRRNNLRVNDTIPVHQDYDLWKKFYDNKLLCQFKPIVTSYYRRDYSKLSTDAEYQKGRNLLLPENFNSYISRQKYKSN